MTTSVKSCCCLLFFPPVLSSNSQKRPNPTMSFQAFPAPLCWLLHLASIPRLLKGVDVKMHSLLFCIFSYVLETNSCRPHNYPHIKIPLFLPFLHEFTSHGNMLCLYFFCLVLSCRYLHNFSAFVRQLTVETENMRREQQDVTTLSLWESNLGHCNHTV